MKLKRLITKKSQEEMVGFVIIIVIVAIIVLVFLAVAMNKPATNIAEKSAEIDRYVLSLSEITSSCAIDFEPNYRTIGELIRECEDGAKCLDDRDSCDVLKSELRNVTISAWPLADRPYKGWEISVIDLQGNITISEGNKTKSYLLGSPLSAVDNIEFKVYY